MDKLIRFRILSSGQEIAEGMIKGNVEELLWLEREFNERSKFRMHLTEEIQSDHPLSDLISRITA